MSEITELDDKYLVIKWTDITEGLNDQNRLIFADLVQKVDAYRRLIRERPVNKYVVLNLDDKIDIIYLNKQLDWIQPRILKVGDIATDLVNAVLKAEINND